MSTLLVVVISRFSQVARALVWAATGSSGVPVGTQRPVPPMIASGCPIEVTLTVPTVNWPLTHGPLPAVGGGKVQALTRYGEVISTVGWADTTTRRLGIVGWA